MNKPMTNEKFVHTRVSAGLPTVKIQTDVGCPVADEENYRGQQHQPNRKAENLHREPPTVFCDQWRCDERHKHAAEACAREQNSHRGTAFAAKPV